MLREEDIEFRRVYPQTRSEERPSGMQPVGLYPSLVIAKHLPTGLVAECGAERSFLKNKVVTLEMLRAGIAALEELGLKNISELNDGKGYS